MIVGFSRGGTLSRRFAFPFFRAVKLALKGHGFSHAASRTKSSSALAAEGRSFDDSPFPFFSNRKAALKGHGFSHAANSTKSPSALAAEGDALQRFALSFFPQPLTLAFRPIPHPPLATDHYPDPSHPQSPRSPPPRPPSSS